MRYAGFWVRVGAGLIDAIITMPIGFIFLWFGGFSIDFAIYGAFVSAFTYPVYNIYFHGKWGQTIGKMAVGIKVVKLYGDNISFIEAFFRNSVDVIFSILWTICRVMALNAIPDTEYYGASFFQRGVRLLEFYPTSLAWVNTASEIWIWSEIIVLLFNKKKRAIHDYIAGTVVIHKGTTNVSDSKANAPDRNH